MSLVWSTVSATPSRTRATTLTAAHDSLGDSGSPELTKARRIGHRAWDRGECRSDARDPAWNSAFSSLPRLLPLLHPPGGVDDQ
jgi:hypothetical protein